MGCSPVLVVVGVQSVREPGILDSKGFRKLWEYSMSYRKRNIRGIMYSVLLCPLVLECQSSEVAWTVGSDVIFDL